MSEWIKCNKAFNEIAKPGMEVRMHNGQCYLVGDTNPSGGQCNCCSLFSYDGDDMVDIVKEYRIVHEASFNRARLINDGQENVKCNAHHIGNQGLTYDNHSLHYDHASNCFQCIGCATKYPSERVESALKGPVEELTCTGGVVLLKSVEGEHV